MSQSQSTPADLAERKDRVARAATEVAREHGIEVTEPRVLHDAFSVVLHLAPSPVVVRVPVVLLPGFSLQELMQRQRRELAVADWLAARGEPVVRVSQRIPSQPIQRHGFSMTFWELVEVDTSVVPDYVASAGAAAPLHAALRDYPGELPFLSPVNVGVPRGLAYLAEHPELVAPSDLERAREEWAVLQAVLGSASAFQSAFPGVDVQPIHGDAPSYNMIATTSGIRYADFEDVTLGPVEWDLAQFGPAAGATYDAAATSAGMRCLDPAVQRVVDRARALQVVACLALLPQLPMLGTGLAPALEQWRSSPPIRSIHE